MSWYSDSHATKWSHVVLPTMSLDDFWNVFNKMGTWLNKMQSVIKKSACPASRFPQSSQVKNHVSQSSWPFSVLYSRYRRKTFLTVVQVFKKYQKVIHSKRTKISVIFVFVLCHTQLRFLFHIATLMWRHLKNTKKKAKEKPKDTMCFVENDRSAIEQQQDSNRVWSARLHLGGKPKMKHKCTMVT